MADKDIEDILDLYERRPTTANVYPSPKKVADDVEKILDLYSGAAPQKPGQKPNLGEPGITMGGKPFTQNGSYNGVLNFANGALLGWGNKLMAGIQALKPGAPAGAYDQALAAYNAGRESYQKENPYTAAATEGAGSMVSAVPLIMTGTGALGAGVDALATVAPRVMARAAPVVDFIAGSGGSNALLRGGSLATRGALEGAAGGALTSGLSPEDSVGKSAAIGAAVGAPFGVAAPVIGKGMEFAGTLARDMWEPMTAAGQNRIVNRLLYNAAENYPDKRAAANGMTRIVPGSTPTLAQASGNPGIASLERVTSSQYPHGFVARNEANQAAREGLVDAVSGDALSLETLRATRDAVTSPMRKAAFASKTDVDPSAVVSTIDNILASPAGQRDAVVAHLSNIRDKFFKTVTGPDGQMQKVMQSDPEQLYGIRKAIGDLLSPLAKQGDKPSAQLAAAELKQVQQALDPVIESGAPGFGGYIKKFNEMSRPIDSQELLQSLKLTDSKGNITLGKVDNAITRIERAQAQSGANRAKSVTDDTMDALYSLRDDLRRKENSALGKAAGSDTFQNFGVNSAMAKLNPILSLVGGYHSGPLGALAMRGVSAAYDAQQPRIMNKLVGALLDPNTQITPPGAVARWGQNLNLTGPNNPIFLPSFLGARSLVAQPSTVRRPE